MTPSKPISKYLTFFIPWRRRSNISSILDDIDILIPLITYLGMNPYWWARSAQSLSEELALDTTRVQVVFERYPMTFRRGSASSNETFTYALQMRYARREDGGMEHLPSVSALPPLTREEVIALIDFLVRISTLQLTVSSAHKTILATAISAMIAAMVAIVVALLKNPNQ